MPRAGAAYERRALEGRGAHDRRPPPAPSAARAALAPQPRAELGREHVRRDLLGALARLVGDDPAVGEEDHAIRVARRDRVVGDHRDGLAVIAARRGEQAEHLAAAARIEVAGRLVGEDEVGRGRERAGDRDALLLPALSWCGRCRSRGREPERLDESVDARALESARPPAVEVERQQDVAERVERRHQVERLEDESDAAAPEDRELEVGERR